MATIKLETFTPGNAQILATNFITKLQNAVNNAPNGSVIDCTSYTGRISFRVPVNITRSVTLLFGNVTLNFSGAANQNMFNVYAPNVKIKGVNNTNAGATQFAMAAGGSGYHVFVGATQAMAEKEGWVSRHGFELHDVELKGIASIIKDTEESKPNYGFIGCGGVHIVKGSPFSHSEFIDDVVLQNVQVNGARNHGILMLGARGAVVNNCTVINACGHGYMLDSGKSNVMQSCRAEACYLAGFLIKGEKYTSLEGCLATLSGLGFFVRATKSVTLTSCGAESNVDRTENQKIGMPQSMNVPVYVPLTFMLDDIGRNKGTFNGTNYVISGGFSVSEDCARAEDARYGYVCTGKVLCPQIITKTTLLKEGDEGFINNNGTIVPDLESGMWYQVGTKPTGSIYAYDGKAYQPHQEENQRVEFHTGWGDAEDLRIYGQQDPEEYGYTTIEGRRVRQLISADNTTQLQAYEKGYPQCPPGFYTDGGGWCYPDTKLTDDNGNLIWNYIGDKNGGSVHQHPAGIIKYDAVYTDQTPLREIYKSNNSALTDFTNEGTLLQACYSKDPGNRKGSVFYTNPKTAHIRAMQSYYSLRISVPVISQRLACKYLIRFELGDRRIEESPWPNYRLEGFAYENAQYQEEGDMDFVKIADILDLTD
jgi:hypothetical protein